MIMMTTNSSTMVTARSGVAGGMAVAFSHVRQFLVGRRSAEPETRHPISNVFVSGSTESRLTGSRAITSVAAG
jgi:hypothetical protein